MTRGERERSVHPHATPRRRDRLADLILPLALGVCAGVVSPPSANAQWRGLPDPPDPPDAIDCVACLDPEDGPPPPVPSTPPAATESLAPRPHHELTLGGAFAITAMVVRPASREGAEYRITLSTREAMLQTSWSIYGRRMVGLRLAVGVAAGKPVLRFEQLGFLDWFLPEPVRLPGVAVSLDVSAGLVVRAGPVRLGPLVAVHTVWLRDARGYAVNEDVPYTTPTRVHATGLGSWIGALLHPRLLLSIDTRAYVRQRLPGASLRLGLAASWGSGQGVTRRGEPRSR